jgi:hypothetical protein
MTPRQEQIALNLQIPVELSWFQKHIKFPLWRLVNKLTKETK